MFAKMTQALLLTGCLIGAGTASASDRNVVVPVIAGAAVGAVLATALSNAGQDHHHRPAPRYREMAYAPRFEDRRPVPPPRHYYRDDRRIDFHDDGRYVNRHHDDHRRW
ncbi:hypothetical protein TRP66_00945 [Pseudomonas sp. JDS28PS106]|uniref:hypothetical protein n=1 Tax=Pseudomonas sp. JDS28PS106 TaxID=2497235 RepID=UPI002FCE6C4F